MGWYIIIEAFTEHYLHTGLHNFLSIQVHYKALEWWIDFQTDSSNASVKLKEEDLCTDLRRCICLHNLIQIDVNTCVFT